MLSLIKRPHSKKYGQILIETVIILPALVILTLGVIDLVRMLYVYEGLTGGVREGARYYISRAQPASGQPDPAIEAKNRVVQYFNNDPIGGNGRFGCVLGQGNVVITNTTTGQVPTPAAWPVVGKAQKNQGGSNRKKKAR